MIACPKCGWELQPGARSCLRCGAVVPDAGAPHVSGAERPSGAGAADDPVRAQLQRFVAALYTVEQPLGRGPATTVYQGAELNPARPVALKVLPPGLGAGAAATRFKDEARKAMGLAHPNIVPIYRVGLRGGAPYFIAMRLVEGRALAAILESQGALPAPALLAVLRSVTEALNYAHGRGTTHGALTPANVLIDRTGNVMVSDFGISRVIAEATADAAVPGGEGTAGEQYQLGLIALQMLGGTALPGADPLTQLHDAAGVRSTLLPALVRLVETALAPDPGRRYASTSDMLAAVKAVPLSDADRREGAGVLGQLARGEAVPRLRVAPPARVEPRPAPRPGGTTQVRAAPPAPPAPKPAPTVPRNPSPAGGTVTRAAAVSATPRPAPAPPKAEPPAPKVEPPPARPAPRPAPPPAMDAEPPRAAPPPPSRMTRPVQAAPPPPPPPPPLPPARDARAAAAWMDTDLEPPPEVTDEPVPNLDLEFRQQPVEEPAIEPVQAPPPEPASAAAAEPATDAAPDRPLLRRSRTAPSMSIVRPEASEPGARSHVGLIAAGVVALAALGAGAYFLVLRHPATAAAHGTPAANPAPTAPAPTTTAAAPPAAANPRADSTRPAPAKPAAAADTTVPASTTGQILLSVADSSSQILVDGTPSGSGGFLDSEVTVGRRHVQISAPGHVTLDTTINVPAGGTVDMGQVALAPAAPTGPPRGWLWLQTAPANAAVVVDGQRAGTGSLTQFEVTAGLRRVQISAPGYQTLDTMISVDVGQDVHVGQLTLKAAPGH